MRDPIACMITTTTYGTWLPGDTRGYVQNGQFLPPSPHLERYASRVLKKDPVFLAEYERGEAREALLQAADDHGYYLLAATVEPWHVHWLAHQPDDVPAMIGRLKTAMRRALSRGRIWSAGYDVRFCFTESEVESRFDYIARHPNYKPLRAPI